MTPRLRIALSCAALALAGGCALPPQGTTEQDRARYDAAVASLGCTIRTEGDYRAVEFQAGLTRDQALAITKYRLAAEQAARLPEGGVKLTTGACA